MNLAMSTEPVRATPAATSTAKPSASVKAVFAASANPVPISASNVDATVDAAPTESRAALADPDGKPATASSILPLYAVLMTEPITATPKAPATCRVTSFIAEAMPALASGTAPITESVDGAITLPMPNARRKKVRPTIPVVGIRLPEGDADEYSSQGCEAQRHHLVGTQPSDQTMADARSRRNSQGYRHHPQSGLERCVSLDELQVLRHSEHHAEQGEEPD